MVGKHIDINVPTVNENIKLAEPIKKRACLLLYRGPPSLNVQWHLHQMLLADKHVCCHFQSSETPLMRNQSHLCGN